MSAPARRTHHAAAPVEAVLAGEVMVAQVKVGKAAATLEARSETAQAGAEVATVAALTAHWSLVPYASEPVRRM